MVLWVKDGPLPVRLGNVGPAARVALPQATHQHLGARSLGACRISFPPPGNNLAHAFF